jgi:hypothetical protein
MSQALNAPGTVWLEIIRRPTFEDFAAAFTEKVMLNASVVTREMVGALPIRQFFDATSAMYGSIAFVHESNDAGRTYLEWEGTFEGKPIAGITVLTRDGMGLIESIRLYHRPYDQVIAFSAELASRLGGH